MTVLNRPRLHWVSAIGPWKSRPHIRLNPLGLSWEAIHVWRVFRSWLPCVPKRHNYLYCHTRCVSPTYDARAAAYCLPVKILTSSCMNFNDKLEQKLLIKKKKKMRFCLKKKKKKFKCAIVKALSKSFDIQILQMQFLNSCMWCYCTVFLGLGRGKCVSRVLFPTGPGHIRGDRTKRDSRMLCGPF